MKLKFIENIKHKFEETKAMVEASAFVCGGTNDKGSVSTGFIVTVVVIFIIASALFPVAMTSFKGAETTNWTTGETAMWGLIPLMAIISLFLGFTPKGK